MDGTDPVGLQNWEDDPYTPVPNALLYQFLLEKKVETFKEILIFQTPRHDFNINHLYGDPHYGSLLDIACQDIQLSDFVTILIQNGAKINLVNEKRGRAPLHFAVELSDIRTLQILLDSARIDLNIVDDTGGTALHLACKLAKLEHVKLLLQHQKVCVNTLDEKNQAPIGLAITNKNEDIVCELLKHKDIDIDIDIDSVETSSKASVRKLISDEFPELALHLPEPRETNRDDVIDNVSKLFLYLRQGNLESFTELLNEYPGLVNSGLGDHTFFQYACEYGLFDFVDLLVTSSADVNRKCATNNATGFMLACERGYYRIVDILASISFTSFSSIKEGTVLHTVIQHSTSKYAPYLGLPESERDYFKCLQSLVKKANCGQLNINKKDVNGNTALHYAAKRGNQNFVFRLLDSGADITIKNDSGKPPLAYISPEILETYLDQCICTNGMLPVDDDYEIHFLYNFLSAMKPRKKSRNSLINGDEEFDENAITLTSDTFTLVCMSKLPEHRPLLIHPVVKSFIHFKWHSIRWFFFCNLAFYVTFWFLLTVYIISFYNHVENFRYIFYIMSQKKKFNEVEKKALGWWVSKILPVVLFILFTMLVLREIFQIFLSPVRYFTSIENWLEIILIIITGIILFDSFLGGLAIHVMETIVVFLPAEHRFVVRWISSIRPQISAVAILLSWYELVLLIGRHPWFCTKIEMFRTMARNFLEVIAWYSILILAFALSFYSLFKDAVLKDDKTFVKPANKGHAFVDPGKSIFKTLVMLTGEFEAGTIPFGSDYGIGYILFVLFIFLISIVLFNLLNGLAVSDTQAIRNDAELVGLVSHAEFISRIETILQKNNDWFRCPAFFCCMNPIIMCIISKLRKILPEPFRQISVLPNKENIVKHVWTRRFKFLCFAERKHFSMDGCIVKTAKEVLKKRTEKIDKEKTVNEHMLKRELETLRHEIFEMITKNCKKSTNP